MLAERKFRSNTVTTSIQKQPRDPFEDSPNQRRKTEPSSSRNAHLNSVIGQLSATITQSNVQKVHSIRSALTASSASSGRPASLFGTLGNSTEKSIFGASAAIFTMDEEISEWKSIDGGISTIAIYNSLPDNLFRLVALSISHQFIINTWIGRNLVLSRLTTYFVSLSNLKSDSLCGISFKTKEDCDLFLSVLQNCLTTLKENARPSTVEYPDNTQEILRTKVIREIILTERTYCSNLEIMIEVFLKPLQASSSSSKPLISSEDIKKIFGTIEIILSYNKSMLQQLDERIANWNQSSRIGDIFARMKHFLKVYVQYVNTFGWANDTLQSLKKSNKSFENFLIQEKNTNPKCTTRGLEDFLILPIQRIPRYVLLLEELLKHTCDNHDDHDELVIALNYMKEIAHQINESKREIEDSGEMFSIYNKVEPKMKDLVQAHRKKVREGHLTFYDGKSKKSRYAFLFNDSLLVTKKESDKDKHQMKALLELGNCTILDSQLSSTSFSLHCVSKTYELVFKTEQEKNQWFSDITSAKEKLQKRKLLVNSHKESHPIFD